MKSVLISGGGIAGLTTGYWMHHYGWNVKIVERASGLRSEGYMIDFFGNGWLVAEKMNITDEIQKVNYPIDNLQYVKKSGEPYFSVPIARLKKALRGKYNYLLRSDLERILAMKALPSSIEIEYSNQIKSIETKEENLEVEFECGLRQKFDIIIGADGVHSKVRRLIFTDENYSYPLDYTVAASNVPRRKEIGNNFLIYQEPNRQTGLYPISDTEMDAIFVFRDDAIKETQDEDPSSTLNEVYKKSGWIVNDILKDVPVNKKIFFDRLEQIRMSKWSKGRIVLVGGACACLTLLAGQGASMAMLEAYILAEEINKNYPDFDQAFENYESRLKEDIEKRQQQAEDLARNFVPSNSIEIALTRWLNRIAFSRIFIGRTVKYLTGKIHIK